jgi:hypothetical protein
MKTPAPPAPPDPDKTAAAQAGMNIDTAQAQQLTNQVNQVTPQGNLTYSRTGENSYVDSKGKTVTIPQYTATTTYSPEQQQLYNTGQQTEQKIADIGLSQAGRIGDILGTPVDLSNEAVEQRLYDLGSKRLDPRFAQEEEALRTRLANQGVGAGSEAYNNAMTQFSQGKNDAYNQLLLSGRGQSVQEILAQRNQIVNETNALMSGSQVNQPNFINTPQAPVAGVDYIGLKNQQYQAQMQQYNAQVANKNAMMGGIFGMIGSGITAFSDEKTKDIHKKNIGKLKDGTPLHLWSYKGDSQVHVGPTAQDVQKTNPSAVGKMGDLLTVDYGKLMEAQ